MRKYGLGSWEVDPGACPGLATCTGCAGVTALLSCGRHFLAAVTSISICAPFGSAATATNVRAGSGFGISST